MADTKITALATGTVLHSDDWLVYVDVHDTSMASTGTDKKLSPAVLTAGLVPFAASGTGHAQGAVPDPGVTAGTTKFLREDSTWAVPGGGGLSAIGNNQILANISGASAVPIGDTLTGIIDSAISNVQGSLLYRDAAAWLALGPGTSGQILASQGAAANPHWITGGGGTGTVTSITAGPGLSGGTITGAGTIAIATAGVSYAMVQNVAATAILGNPTGSPAAPSEITLGPNLAFSGTTLRGRVPLVWVIAPGTAVSNTTTLTSLFAGATLGGSLTIPANTLNVGSMLRFDLFGTCSDVNPVTLTVQVLLGGVIIGQGTTSNMATATNAAWAFETIGGMGFQCQAIGASGKVIGLQRFDVLGGGSVTCNVSGTSNGTSSQATVNTTGALALDVKVQWSAVSASDTIQLLGGAIYLDF